MNKWNFLIISNRIEKSDILDNNGINNKYLIDVIIWDKIKSYNLEDYDVIFFDFQKSHIFKNSTINHLRPILDFKLEQFIFIFASKCEALAESRHNKDVRYIDFIYSMWKEIPESSHKEGKKIILINSERRISKLLFNELESNFFWNWAVEQSMLPEHSYPLAKNKKENVVSLIWKKKKKFLIFLPHPQQKNETIKKYINNIEEIKNELFIQTQDIILKKPDWLKEYDLFNKIKLYDKKKEIEEKIKKIELYEILLYGYGKPLESAIYKIFSYLGFQNILQTKEKADLICETPNTKIIAEIKGLKNIAYERNI